MKSFSSVFLLLSLYPELISPLIFENKIILVDVTNVKGADGKSGPPGFPGKYLLS